MRVEQLWRYPVKSLGGEPLPSAHVDALGVAGDRRLAVLDDKDEVTWAGAVPPLMQTEAVTLGDGTVELRLPGGGAVRTDDPGVHDRLTAAVGAKVHLAPLARPHQPHSAVHLVTTATLATLSRALPHSAVDQTRFRPNIVLAVPGDGHPEHTWVGRTLAIGTLRLRITEGCDRCVVITKETPTVPHDRDILRWVAREIGNTLGVYAAVEQPGEIRVGDEAQLLG